MVNITLLIGCPGAGKSTFASSKNFDIIINDDDIKDSNPNLSVSDIINIITKKLDDIISETNTDTDVSVCVDAFVLTYYSVRFSELYDAEVVYIKKSLETCLSNNKKRNRHVSEDVIKSSYKYLEENKEFFSKTIKSFRVVK